MVRWSAAVFVITMGIALIYRYGPRKRDGRRTPWLTPGAAFAVVMWVAASMAFSEYLANFGRYKFLVLLGGALNAQLERRWAARA